MVINIRPPWSYYTTDTRYISFSFYDDNIFTTITKDPNIVAAWISETENINGHRLLIGLDIEWRPSFHRGVENKIATLQLCVGHRCLIFQIIHSPYIPQSLIDFLNYNPCYTFTGVGIHADAEKLVRDYNGLVGGYYGLTLGANMVDLGSLAAQVYGDYKMKSFGLKALARVVLGKEPEKPRHVTVSNWDDQWLSPEQIEYASIDGFLSFEIGRVLMGL